MAGSKPLNVLVSAVLTVVLIPGIPVFLVVFVLPILGIRCLVVLLRRLLVPRSGKILSPLSAFFAADRMYSPYPLSTNLINIVLDGNVSFEKMRNSLIDNVLKKTDSANQLAYPELQQKVVPWLGFHFWEDSDFNVDNHIRLVSFPGYEDKTVPPEVYVPFLKSLLREPFLKDRSPWEIVAIHNYKDPHEVTEDPRTLVVYRIHHALSGGYSSMNLLLDHGGLTASRVQAQFPKFPLWMRVLWYLAYIVRAPFEMCMNLIEAIDDNAWKLPSEALVQEKSAAVSRPVSVDFVKGIKKKHETSFSAVISAALAGGMREYMIEKGLKVPESIHVMTPWPVRDIPDRLGNFLTGVILEYPIGDPNPVSRMHKIHSNFIKMKYSTVATTNYFLLKVMGRTFYWLLRPAHKNLMATTIMSNIAGPNERQICLGHGITDMSFVANFMCANVALGFTVLSYNGNVKLVCGADRTIMPNDSDAEALMAKILQQLEVLAAADPVTSKHVDSDKNQNKMSLDNMESQQQEQV